MGVTVSQARGQLDASSVMRLLCSRLSRADMRQWLKQTTHRLKSHGDHDNSELFPYSAGKIQHSSLELSMLLESLESLKIGPLSAREESPEFVCPFFNLWLSTSTLRLLSLGLSLEKAVRALRQL
ncbi:hypothetical protein FOCG_02498 [Fusarium oxysporum f. sp. radicis-lycopersici 26381]|uniref:Uncharacterized protein n=1 Tax=Fusarium oxysporum Fo47 TaxID=660027 RepID=W9KMH1_FUSOX|nr:hypothetical protein FOZG_07346 [Fusarium oxysporum Fo47]EXA00488.1 hypothetical protein FOWG_00699 [Fusarium oxysporum f. sp. lycopersici MN25]EXL59168.1 hypothetical protein FOCG_02498 [Fusarium oxysporum f. sp. radicis-lycopersici 26381]EWZ42414.1 hypothetical protein FOZG_07346 [Fusarium oxysporum Fo47]EXA00489.1 hypothetical protein FOWG_00699 [Fusarium oxysporum f. sp. lycopersici MN25]